MVNPRQLSQTANILWAVSQSTADDLQTLYQIKKEKIKVVYSPFDYNFFTRKNFSLQEKEVLRKKYNLPKKFILSLSTLEPRKNLISLIKAFELFQKNATVMEEKELTLVIAGGKGWLWKETLSAVEKSPVKDKIFLIGFVQKKEKPCLYQLADIFVYPSLFEGFGYPPLEAMASGLPVIASNNSSLPEIIDQGGLLIDPFRPFEIYLGLKELIENSELRKYYQTLGRWRAKDLVQQTKNQVFQELKETQELVLAERQKEEKGL